jgi:hypothetical protein
VLNILFFGLELVLELAIDVLHRVLLLPQLIYLLAQFIVLGRQLIQLLVGPHQLVLIILSFLQLVASFHSAHQA